MRLFLVGILVGVGAGLLLGGLFAIVSPFKEAATNFGILGLGAGLLIGGIAATILLRQRKDG
jgi:hypothetical protein